MVPFIPVFAQKFGGPKHSLRVGHVFHSVVGRALVWRAWSPEFCPQHCMGCGGQHTHMLPTHRRQRQKDQKFKVIVMAKFGASHGMHETPERKEDRKKRWRVGEREGMEEGGKAHSDWAWPDRWNPQTLSTCAINGPCHSQLSLQQEKHQTPCCLLHLCHAQRRPQPQGHHHTLYTLYTVHTLYIHVVDPHTHMYPGFLGSCIVTSCFSSQPPPSGTSKRELS